MSAGPHGVPNRTPDQAVLCDLLHSLSQPLTTLRCSLELSADPAGPWPYTVSAALEQTDRMIAVVRLMREYLETDSESVAHEPVPLGPVLRGVVARLSSVAMERQVGLHLTGGCNSTVTLAEPKLQLALHYLIGILVEGQPRHSDISLRLERGPSEYELWAQVEPCLIVPPRLDPVTNTLHTLQLAIATRLFESAGASLEFDRENRSGFLLRIPEQPLPDIWESLS